MLGFVGPSFILFGIAAVVAAAILLGYLSERKRSTKLSQAAEELGFHFEPRGDDDLLASLSGFQLASQGHSRKLKNLLRAEASGTNVAIFDYRYTTGGGKESHTFDQTVLRFSTATLDLPDFSLKPESFLHKLGKLFGFHDINFADHPEFSRKYLLRGNDEDAIRRVFRAEILAFFEDQTGLNVESSGNCLIVYRAGKRVKPENLRSFLEEGFRIFELFKS